MGRAVTKKMFAFVLIAAFAGLPGCAISHGPVASQRGPGPEPDPSTADPQPADPSLPGPASIVAARAQNAVEGLLLGAVIGAQAGPIGAAVGAGTMAVYAAATGHVPLSGGRERSRDPEEIEQHFTELPRDKQIVAYCT